MSKNREMFKEAIAEADALKKMAIENAKKSLEETFTPHLQTMLSAKIQEMEEGEVKENEEVVNETEEVEESVESTEEVKEEAVEEAEVEEGEINLDELLAELNEDEEVSEEVNETEEINENEDLTEKKKKEDEPETEETEEDAEIDLDNMSAEDLKSFIEGVIQGMVAGGEIKGGTAKGKEGSVGKTKEEKPKKPKAEKSEDEEVNIDEIIASLNEDEVEVNEEEKVEENNEELDEALDTIETLREEMNKMNLLNSKLLYVNKIFKAKNLQESIKKKVLSSFDKAKTVKEVKVVYETLLESLNEKKTVSKNIVENMGSASKVIKTTKINESKNPIVDTTNATFARWAKLAGLSKE